MSKAVIDASALLAFLRNERGGDLVEERLIGGAAMSTVNWSEALASVAERGTPPETVLRRITTSGILGRTFVLHPFTQDDALAAARLRPSTRAHGLSLADRACVALAERLAVSVVTADRAWADAPLPVQVELIR